LLRTDVRLRFESQQIGQSGTNQAQPTHLEQFTPPDPGMVLMSASESVHDRVPCVSLWLIFRQRFAGLA